MFTRIQRALVSVLLLSGSFAANDSIAASKKLKICKKGTNVFAAARCRGGASELNISQLTGAAGATGAQGASGANGSNGATGADGVLGIYGDGSAGALQVDGSVIWLTTPPTNYNLQFTSCNIPSGATLFVPSGTVIRCKQSVSIAGTLAVSAARNGGRANRSGSANNALVPAFSLPGAGIAAYSAGMGEFGLVNAGANSLAGGPGALGVTGGSVGVTGEFLGSLLRGASLSGGGGAAVIGEGFAGLESQAGDGGGSVAIISQGAISISGSITADGGPVILCLAGGCGGGAGGVVVIASATSIALSGSVSASGSAGRDSAASTGPGGGGGGGIIQYIAPIVPTITAGNSIVTAGAAGASAGNGSLNSATLRQAGGGGGGCGGGGGYGGSAPETNGAQTPGFAFAAGDGVAVAISANPAALLVGP